MPNICFRERWIKAQLDVVISQSFVDDTADSLEIPDLQHYDAYLFPSGSDPSGYGRMKIL